MSKDLNNTERHLKELADKYQPVPPPVVWDEIEQVLDKNERKRRPFPILWTLGVLILGAVMCINSREKKDQESPLVEQETTIRDYQKQSDPDPGNILTTKWFGHSQPIPYQPVLLLDRPASSAASLGHYVTAFGLSPKPFIERYISTVDSKVIKELNEEQNTNNLATTTPVSDQPQGKKVASQKLESFVTQQHPSNNLDTSTVNRSLEISTNTINSNETAIIAKEDIPLPSVFPESTEYTLEDRSIVQVDTLPRLNWMVRSIETEISLPKPTENWTDNILDSGSNGNASLSKPWFIELGVGMGSNLRNPLLIDSTQGGFRMDTERRWYSWSASLQAGYQFDNHWYTTIGFDLNQTKNRFEFWRHNITRSVEDENQSLQIINGDFFNIGEIRYTFADVGLSIGRRFNTDKWHFSLEGGPIFNVLFNASGKVQVGVMEFSRLEDQEEYFNTQIGIGARLSAMLDYPISDQMWVSVGPIYHQYFNTLSSDENPLEERNAILQVKARVRYHF